MDTVQEIKERLAIEELVSEYLTLKPAGVHLKGLCPFHAEKTPSFIVTPERGTFHCFGCGKHGDIFTFIEEIEGIDFKEALRRLADKVGVEVKDRNFADKQSSKENKKLLEILNKAANFYKQELQKENGARKYLSDRGLSKEIIEKFSLGFAPDAWDAVLKYLLSLGYKTEEIEKAGLIKTAETGKTYDRFRSRIMFPIYNEKGEVAAFSGRIFAKDNDKSAKYINSPETPIYNKSSILYGYHIAKQSIRKYDFSILVEGQADLLAMHQAGFSNTVALSGTALTDKHLSLLVRFSKNILLALDSDDAGVTAMIKNVPKLFSLGFDVKVLALGAGEDPADVLKKEGADAIKELVKDALNIIDFLIKHFHNKLQNQDKYAKLLREKVVPLLAFVESKTEKELLANKLAKAMAVSAVSVLADAEREQPQMGSMSDKTPSHNKQETKGVKERVLDLYILNNWLTQLKAAVISEKDKTELVLQIDELLADNRQEDVSEEYLLEAYNELDKTLLSSDNIKSAAQDFINTNKKFLLKWKLDLMTAELRNLEATANELEAEKLSVRIAQLAKELAKL